MRAGRAPGCRSGADRTCLRQVPAVRTELPDLSNGQALDADEADNAALLQSTFLDDPNSDLFDDVSRGVNFISLEGSFRFGRNRAQNGDGTGACPEQRLGCFNLWVRVIPFYISDDNPVTWGPDLGRDRVADYDRVRTVLSKQQNFLRNDFELGVEWTVGDDGFDTDSLDVFAYLPEPNILG